MKDSPDLNKKLKSINKNDDLWSKFTLTELRKLTAMTSAELDKALPKKVSAIIKAMASRGQAGSNTLRCGDCCWQICHFNI